jgi:4-hydroxy-2-oxoheptanedioate aldolase
LLREKGKADVKQDIGYEFKLALQQGKKAFGPLLGPGNDPEPTVAAIREFGYDYFMVDNEHSLVSKETIYTYIRLAREYELPVLMRPEDNQAPLSPYADSGIQGFMVPQVDTVAEASLVADRLFFPPVGHRGSGIGMSPYLIDGMDAAATPLATMTEYVNRNVILLPQTESLAAVKNLSRILAVEGVTGTVVGTNDLALDIGDYKPDMLRPVVNSQPYLEERLREVVAACRAAGKVAGIGGFSAKGYAKWAREGYQFFTLGYIRDNNVQKMKPVLDEARDLIG